VTLSFSRRIVRTKDWNILVPHIDWYLKWEKRILE